MDNGKQEFDLYAPFAYGQKVKWLYKPLDPREESAWVHGKVQGTAQDPNMLFISYGGGGRAILKSRLFAVEEYVDHNSEADPVPAMKRYYDEDKTQIVYIGDTVSEKVKAMQKSKGPPVEGVVTEFITDILIGVRWNGRHDVDAQHPHRLVLVKRDEIAGLSESKRATLSLEHDDCAPMPSAAPAHFSGLDAVTKDTNPKDALAGFKPRWFSFVPLRVLVGVGMAMFEGGWKYGKHNYRQSGVRASVYVDAAVCGHLTPWMEGQNVDENGRCHIDKAIASLMVLKDSMIGGNWIDDRPLAATNFAEHMVAETDSFQTMKAGLKDKFGDPVAPYTEATRGQPR